MDANWRILPHDMAVVRDLERSASIPPIVAQLLVCRGIRDAETAREFLDAKLSGLRDPELLPGVEQAAERIHAAIKAEKKITIYGDYDADGITSTAILYRCLKLMGASVSYYVPHRIDEGYGLNVEALEKLAERDNDMVITVDCGIASVAEAARAKELGIELIVTDHHEMGEQLPDASVLVHPRLPGTAYPFGGLCGAGVALKLAWALCQLECQSKRVTDRFKNYLLSAVGLASIGTVADVVPLTDENRLLVRHGLNCLREFPVPGISALMKITGLQDKPFLASDDIGFTMAPRLNAAGRLGQAQLGIELLTTDSNERALALAEYLHQLNDSRSSLERSVQMAATKQIKEQFDPENDPALVLAGHGWHPGIIGIVAGRLSDKYNRPVVMIALDEAGVKPGVGSCRSANGLNLHEALQACDHLLLGHGGHAAAAGLQIDEAQIETFRHEFCEYAAANVTDKDRISELVIDAEAPFSQLTRQIVEQIDQLGPFGQSNPRPLMCVSGAKLASPPKRIGGGERHLAIHLEHHGVKIRGVAFGRGEWAEELEANNGPLDVAYHPVINTFRGRSNVELQLVAWKPAAAEITATPSG
ncbi:single-stranded-DNA-specific exonuclease RecJ [Bremerella sp. T1]|uniref:single-stranded-DNA-specific exonuclease RecJ n=1 Tax=Bremerella sp. TYQ1 TaxID=3119568 RepID=UPI001CCE32F0|nr:single-stranded-DNA-specific exonuclease RecJ [Bremerella volcania]UBM33722.1 single-stranded-DNA-specific exonuclease RecJ [Bremerella volcania]